MTEQQYMQLMAQQRGGQQRQPSPEQQAMMMQQQQMQEGPGAAGGFMGGLLDSALIGLLPNSSYQNPNNPANVGASKMGGLIGMILPMLLAKYGAGKVLSSLASKEGMLANWMGKTAQGVERTTEQLGRADMLASVLGGGIGGGLAEGPVGGLLGAAGMGAYSKFAGAGAAMAPEDTYAISKLFGGGKVTKPLTAEQKAIKDNMVKLSSEEAKAATQRVRTVYDPKTKAINLTEVIDDAPQGFEKIQYGKAVVGDKEVYVRGRDIIEGYKANPEGKVVVKRASRSDVTRPDGTHDKTPVYAEAEEKTFAQMYQDLIESLYKAKAKDGKAAFLDTWGEQVKKYSITEKTKVSNGIGKVGELETQIYKNSSFPSFRDDVKYEFLTSSTKRTNSPAKVNIKEDIKTPEGEEADLEDIELAMEMMKK